MRKLFVNLLALLLLLTLTACSATPYSYKLKEAVQREVLSLSSTGKVLETKSGSYKEICRTDSQALYADMSTGFFVLEDLGSGRLWFSVPDDLEEDEISRGILMQELSSQIVVGYIFREDENISTVSRYIGSSSGSQYSDGITTEQLNNGIRVTYDFPDYEFTIPVEYVLEADHFEARVLLDEIKEDGLCYVTEISLLPNFGAANWDANGYVFIPEGSGAISYFNKGLGTTTYEGRIYGSDLIDNAEQEKEINKEIRMPVFSLVYEDVAIVGIVENGVESSSIIAQTRNEECGYNFVGSRCYLRHLFNKKLFQTDANNVHSFSRASMRDSLLKEYSVRYYTLSKPEISYVDVAKTYQNYLTKEKTLKKQDTTPVMNIKYYGFIDCKRFFAGIPYTGKMSLTSFTEAQKFTEYLLERQVDSLAISYSGWAGDGLTNDKVQDKATPTGKLGGKKAFNNLLKVLKENNITFSPDVELLRFSSNGNGYSIRKNAARSVFSDQMPLYRYNVATGLPIVENDRLSYLLKSSSAHTAYLDYLKSFLKLETKSVMLSSLGCDWYTSWDAKAVEAGLQTIDTYCEILKAYSKDNSIVLYDSNAYALPYASRIIGAPVNSGSNDFFSQDVPFYEIVLHGYIPMSSGSLSNDANPELAFLQTVEAGLELYFDGFYEDASVLMETDYKELYSKTCDLWADKAIEYYNEYMPLLKQISDSEIIGHKRINPTVVQVIYDNGINVLVNYGEKTANVSGHKVDAKGFIYWKG